MRDVIYLVITLAFFAICFGLVRACEVLLGPDPDDLLDDLDEDSQDRPCELVGVRT